MREVIVARHAMLGKIGFRSSQHRQSTTADSRTESHLGLP